MPSVVAQRVPDSSDIMELIHESPEKPVKPEKYLSIPMFKGIKTADVLLVDSETVATLVRHEARLV